MLFTLGLGLFVVNAAGAIIVLYANSFVMKNRSKEWEFTVCWALRNAISSA